MRRVSVTLLCVFLLAACTVGHSEFSCNSIPDQPTCMSTTDAYDATNGNGSISDFEKPVVTKEEKPIDSVISDYVTPNLPNKPVPIRTPAKVMRIWVSTWEDNTGMLISPGYLFTEIEPRRWVIGRSLSVSSQHNRLFQPLAQPNRLGE